MAQCVARYAKPELDAQDIDRFMSKGIAECFDRSDPSRMEKRAACLPLTLGKDRRNGRMIELAYTCSDLCPAYGVIATRYVDVTDVDCCAAGGIPVNDAAWGTYRGCHPPEVPLRRSRYCKAEGGALEYAAWNPCDPDHYRFDDGTLVPMKPQHRCEPPEPPPPGRHPRPR